ncbi:hypothetical protein KCP74_10605 [Salmonella enterica subsp. enterica]|nr:hypothetical protein KCP74_10605 [Salmonella enterica subsp. enterica]
MAALLNSPILIAGCCANQRAVKIPSLLLIKNGISIRGPQWPVYRYRQFDIVCQHRRLRLALLIAVPSVFISEIIRGANAAVVPTTCSEYHIHGHLGSPRYNPPRSI